MIKLLTIATHLADSLHYLRGVRFDVTDVADNADYQKALELGQKAHEQLLAMIDEMEDAIVSPTQAVVVQQPSNPLQRLIDELYKNKSLHSQLAKNAESENSRYNSNYIHFEKGVAYGFELAIEMLAKFQLWNDARTNPPKFDENRKFPYITTFLCVIKYEGEYHILDKMYDFTENEWLNNEPAVLFWQEYPALPKEVLE